MRRCEDGAADLRRRVEELSKNLEDCEKEYQVKIGYILFLSIADFLWYA